MSPRTARQSKIFSPHQTTGSDKQGSKHILDAPCFLSRDSPAAACPGIAPPPPGDDVVVEAIVAFVVVVAAVVVVVVVGVVVVDVAVVTDDVNCCNAFDVEDKLKSDDD